jgi:hypothetical protein
MTLFQITNSYDIGKLKEICRNEIKKKFPHPVEDEEFDEYLQFIEDETDLLYAERLKKIANEIEKRILGGEPQKIQKTY